MIHDDAWSRHVMNAEAFVGEGFQVGVGGQLGFAQLFNPVGSGIRLRLRCLETMPIFGLEIPKVLDGVDASILNPRNVWSDKDAYDAQAAKLAQMFVDSFKTYTDTDEGKALESIGPELG